MELNKKIDFSYNEVKEQIKRKIISKKYKADEKIPSERNLCGIFNVSRTTVRKAIEELVVEGYLVKRPGKGTFVRHIESFNQGNDPNIPKSSGMKFNDEGFSHNKTGNIIFLRCIHHHFAEDNTVVKDDIFYPKVLAGIDSIAATKDYHCIFKYVYEQDLDDKSIQNIINKTDAIICAELHSKTFHDKLLASNLPLVLLNPSIISNKADVVGIDDFAGAYRAVEYLLSQNHKEIAFIGGPCESFPGKYRKYGYLEALSKAGLEADYSRILSYNWRLEDGYQATLELLKLKKRPTAIFAASDLLAIGAINAIKDSGLSVPDDISVLGFDDIEMASQIRPNLSTMRVRKKEIGESAAKLIFEKMESYSAYSVNLSIPTLLQERDSVRKI